MDVFKTVSSTLSGYTINYFPHKVLQIKGFGFCMFKAHLHFDFIPSTIWYRRKALGHFSLNNFYLLQANEREYIKTTRWC